MRNYQKLKQKIANTGGHLQIFSKFGGPWRP